jgi:hypothetical protein
MEVKCNTKENTLEKGVEFSLRYENLFRYPTEIGPSNPANPSARLHVEN